MFDETAKYKTNDHFFYRKGDNLTVVSKDVPAAHGVFYIFRLARGNVELVCIGKAGTVQRDGSLDTRGLQFRINTRDNGTSRQKFFEAMYREFPYDGLDIYWFVTMDKQTEDLPSYVEALLLQRYFEVHRKLPPWNDSF